MWIRRGYNHLFRFRRFCTQTLLDKVLVPSTEDINQFIPEPEYDTDFILNQSNRDIIFHNIQSRKGVGDIDKVLQLSQEPDSKELLLRELSKIPNQTHPDILQYNNKPKVLQECGSKPEFDFEPKDFAVLAEKLKMIRRNTLGPVAGQRAYILLGDLAELEEALVQYTTRKLMDHGFKFVSVPDIIPTQIIERCGLVSENGRTLIYNLDPYYGPSYSLSGTAEMSLAYKTMNTTFSNEELPVKMAAVSRCFRAETSSIAEERGIYRVHQFTKVEMFVCSTKDRSEEQFQKLLEIQKHLFSSLDLHFQVVDMPPHDLGAPAYRKIDMEGWMPGRKLYGELSSCSNCTDYQSRRLNIKYKDNDGKLLHVHTLNGTGCAIPRMLIAICESHQTTHGQIKIPEKLVPYMNGKTHIQTQTIPSMRVYKYKPKVQ